MQALTTVQQSLTTLRSSQSRLEANLKELAEIQALKVQLDAKTPSIRPGWRPSGRTIP